MTTYTSPQDGTTLDTRIVNGGSADTNYSTLTELYIGEPNSNTYVTRALMQFPGLTNGDVPSSAVITSAKLYLKITADYCDNARTLRAFRSKRDVNISQATWTIWKTGSNWATAGGFGTDDCEQTDIGNLSLTASETVGSWKEITLTASAIQEIVKGTWTTPTLLLKVDTETNDLYIYASSNATTSTNRPYLVVEYVLGGQVIIWTSE